MREELLKRLKGVKLLDDSEDIEFISTGCYALNRSITGDYHKGLAVGHIYEISGENSTGKSLFVTTFLRAAQENKWITFLLDAENTFSKDFSKLLGLNPKELFYSNPTTIEECFDEIESKIKLVREVDKTTPMIFCIDSLAVLPAKIEVEDRDSISHAENTDGARRALATGNILKKITPLLKQNRCTLVIVNQLRSKINSGPYQNPDTKASGGRSLPFYLSVAIHLTSNKTSDVVRDKKTDEPIGVQGDIKIAKNKLGIPFRTCEFRVLFNQGLDKYFGLLDLLILDGKIQKSDSGRVSCGNTKFSRDDFITHLLDKNNLDFTMIRDLLKLEV